MTAADDDRARAAVAQLPVTFRPLVTRVVLLTMGVLLCAALSTLAVVMPWSGASPWTTADRITLVAVGVLGLALLALLSRPRAVARADGLTVVNLIVTRRLAWAEVLAVRLRPGDAWVHLDLADGTTLAVMGIQPGIATRRAIGDARRLRALVEALGEARDGDLGEREGPR